MTSSLKQDAQDQADAAPTNANAKYYVLDTNVLLHNSNALFVFQDNHVVIPYPVIEELDAMTHASQMGQLIWLPQDSVVVESSSSA